jgi:hypothetical protein
VRDDPTSIEALRLRRAFANDLLVIGANYHAEGRRWRVVLALDGARHELAALVAIRDAIAVVQRLEPVAGLDLTLVDPGDATVEWRVTLDAEKLVALRPDDVDAAWVGALTSAAHA